MDRWKTRVMKKYATWVADFHETSRRRYFSITKPSCHRLFSLRTIVLSNGKQGEEFDPTHAYIYIYTGDKYIFIVQLLNILLFSRVCCSRESNFLFFFFLSLVKWLNGEWNNRDFVLKEDKGKM